MPSSRLFLYARS